MRSFRIAFLIAAGVLPAACANNGGAGTGRQVAGQPVETRPPNASAQSPAFEGQTRAPFLTTNVALKVERVAGGLDHPWGLAFLPGGDLLITERPGRLRIITGSSLSAPVAGVPAVDAEGQGGLLDVALSPSFVEDQLVYVSYSEPRDGGNGTAVARGRLVRDAAPRLDDVKVIWRMQPTLESSLHFGSRLVFTPDGHLFVATGERSIAAGRKQAQQLDSAFGKVVRLKPDGAPAPANPFAAQAGALPEIWSYGHRNIQAAALHPRTGELWVVEHGARGGDEVNVARAGKNYGWPTISYGIEYAGGPIGEGITAREGLEQPVYYWDPVIAPSGMAFYDADLFPAWKGSLLVGGLAGKHIARLTLDGEKVVGEERLLTDRARFRDVRVGPEGAVYALTDDSKGEVLRIVPGP